MQQVVKGLVDYKFYWFDGEAQFLYVSKGLEDYKTARISLPTMDWLLAPFRRIDYGPYDNLSLKLSRFDEMQNIANRLSKGHAFLRVDMYQINGHIFPELTFHPCSGLMSFKPQEWDEKLGNTISLTKKNRNDIFNKFSINTALLSDN